MNHPFCYASFFALAATTSAVAVDFGAVRPYVKTEAGISLVEDIKLESPKTKGFVEVMSKLGLAGTTLFVAAGPDKNLRLASRNIQDVELTTSDVLNTYQVLRSNKLVFTRGAFDKLQERLQD